ncbi:MAG: hypothetical protein OEM98_04760 [Gammaproteobacteria bacterium]|nr:hypothetical protein [Gammaproteobacteria bacterium]
MSASKISRLRSGARAGIGALLLLSVSACASTSEPVPPCCYKGDFELAHVRDVQLALSDGKKIEFSQAFPGYKSQTGLFTTGFPFNKVEIAQVTYTPLQPVLPQYDANGNGRLEEPELTILYIREAALGLGLNDNHVEVDNRRTGALVLPADEIGGLVRYVNGNVSRMTPSAQDIFQKLDWLGRDLRTKGSENDGMMRNKIFVP